jgi:hypothetical protein
VSISATAPTHYLAATVLLSMQSSTV